MSELPYHLIQRKAFIKGTVVFLLLIACCGNIYGGEIEKTDFGLTFIYNYYYDKDYLDSLKKATNDSADTKPGEAETIFPQFLHQYIHNDCLYFDKDSIPHLSAKITWNSTREKLRKLGVIPGANRDNVFDIRFPLSLLPDLAANKNTERIKYPDSSDKPLDKPPSMMISPGKT